MGFDRVIVVLTQPASYRKGPMNKALIRVLYGKYPNLCRTLMERHERYNAQAGEVRRLEKEGKIFVIRPKEPLNIRRLEKNPKELARVHGIGLRDAEESMTALKAYLEA